MRFGAVVGIVAIGASLSCDSPESARHREPRPLPEGAAASVPSGVTVADIAARVGPTVVDVFAERNRSESILGDRLLERFHEGVRQQQLGAGVIVDSDGVILTNSHLVADADAVRIGLQDGRELSAEVVGLDPESDIAVLRVDAGRLPALEMGDSSTARPGDFVLAVGNPFGIGQSVTMGIISAIGRSNVGILDDEDFLQTDAAINPGSSGGPLVDLRGKLVGINTAIASRSGGYQGIGFAIPSNLARHIKDEILDHGTVTRGFLGITVQDVSSGLAHKLDLTARRGAVVVKVAPGSPAARTGIEDGDVITSVDGKAVTSAAQLRTVVALNGTDHRIKLGLLREGKPITLEVDLVVQPGDLAELDSGALSGLTVRALDTASRKRYRVPDVVQGVLVTHVDPESTADELGLQLGDVIVAANHKRTGDAVALRKAASADASRIVLLVCREGAALLLASTD